MGADWPSVLMLGRPHSSEGPGGGGGDRVDRFFWPKKKKVFLGDFSSPTGIS